MEHAQPWQLMLDPSLFFSTKQWFKIVSLQRAWHQGIKCDVMLNIKLEIQKLTRRQLRMQIFYSS